MIFLHIRDARTAFRLGAANTRLMIIGERRIKQLMGNPNWSGDRIICLRTPDADEEEESWDEGEEDDVNGSNDAGIKDDNGESKDDGGEKKDKDNGGDDEGDGNNDREDGTKDEHDGDDDSGDEDDGNDAEAGDNGDEENEDGGIALPDGLELGGDLKHFTPPGRFRWADIHSGLVRDLEHHMPEHRIASSLAIPVGQGRRPEVIWNLTKHAYVRSDAIPPVEALPGVLTDWFDSGDGGSDRDNILGWILLLHIMWTNVRFVPGDEFGDAFHGKWAGDRIEATTKDVLETRLKKTEGEWTDVSEEAIQLFLDVYNALS